MRQRITPRLAQRSPTTRQAAAGSGRIAEPVMIVDRSWRPRRPYQRAKSVSRMRDVGWAMSQLMGVRDLCREYAHVQQAVVFSEIENVTVLAASLEEGAAEFVAELSTGSISYSYMKGLTAGRERQIETAFAADADKTDLSDWLYNSTPEQPADLGYWVGYRIVKSYYQQAADKRQALRDILKMTNPKEFLAKSGWRPGVALD